MMIDVKEEDRIGMNARQRNTRVGAQLGEIDRRHAVYGLHVAGEDRRDARRVVRDQPHRRLPPMRLVAPIPFIALEFYAVAGKVADELERPGADRRPAGVEFAGRGFGVLARDDGDRRKIDRQQRRRRVRNKAHRMRIDNNRFLDRAGVDIERRRAVGHPADALDRDGHVRGVEIRSVVELDAVAKLELPGRVVQRLPLRGESGPQILPLVLLDQAIEDVHGDVDVGRQIVEMRVHRRDRRRQSQGHFLRADRRGHRTSAANPAPIMRRKVDLDMSFPQNSAECAASTRRRHTPAA